MRRSFRIETFRAYSRLTSNYPWQQSLSKSSPKLSHLQSDNKLNFHVVTSIKLTSQLSTAVDSTGPKCWKCGSSFTKEGNNTILQTCSACKALQNLDPSSEKLNFFKIFKLPETYQIDVSKLSKEMKILQRSLHPDLFSMKTKEEQQISDQLSALVNKAYAVLQNPMERAEYLLSLRGIDSHTREKSITMDTEFLMNVMELNERVEEINDVEDLAKFRKDNNAMLHDLINQLQAAFLEDDIDRAVLVVSKMKYYDNVQIKLKAVQSRLGVVD